MEATGGTTCRTILIQAYRLGKAHYYLASGSFIATIGTETEGDKVDYYVIAAGGGGGNHIGGGAGAGGSVSSTGLAVAITSGTHPVTIAATTTGGTGSPIPRWN